MAVTLGGFIAVRLLVTLFARPHYVAAKTVSTPVPVLAKLGGSWWATTASPEDGSSSR